MKTKYTLQELKDKSIIINCPTKTMADKVCNALKITANRPWDEMSNLLWVYYHESKPDFFPNDYLFSPSKIIIPASEFFLEDEPTPEVKPVLDYIESLPMPGVIEIATTEFDLFLKEWNGLHKKAMKIKSINALRNLTKKIKEL